MKRAIVLAGGGAKGAYQIGFWMALRELGIDFDIVTGSSVGALNAALFVQGDFDAALSMWENIKTEDIFEKSPSHISTIMNTEGLANGLKPIFGDLASDAVNERFDSYPLAKLIESRLDEEKVRSSGKILGIMTTEYPIFKCASFTLNDIPKGRIGDYLLASSTVFPSMEPKAIRGKKYVDGGYSDNIPVNLALDLGANEIIACFLNASGVNGKYQTDYPVRIVKPHFYLGPSMDFDSKTAKRNIVLGYNDTMRSFGNYEGHWYTFQTGESEKFLRKYSWVFANALEEFKICKHSDISHFYECSFIKNFADSKNARAGTMARFFPILAAETAGEIYELDPLPVYTEEFFTESLLKAYEPTVSETNAIQEILTGKSSIAAKTKMLSDIDSKTIVSYFTENMAKRGNDKTIKTNLALLSRIAPGEFLASIYISKIKGTLI